MPIAPSPKKEPRPVLITVRVSKKGAEAARKLSAMLNKSQGEIVDHLLLEELKAQEKKTR